MIKLFDLLKEIVSPQNKMIILAGGAGVGKSTLIDKIKGLTPGFEIINPDKYIEDKASSMFNNLSAASAQVDDVDVPNALSSGKSFIWDTTASNAAKLLGGLYKRKETPGLLNAASNYDTLMIMVYAHPIVSFLRNFKRERKVPKIGVISTWNNVYGNIDAYKNKLGDNFVLYQAPDDEYKKEIEEFNQAVQQGKLYEWLEELTSQNPEQFVSTFRKTQDSPLSPEEQAKKDKATEKSRELFKQLVSQLEREFITIDKKIKDSVLSEPELISKVKSFNNQSSELNEAEQQYKLYCDMDGVLVDFEQGYNDLTGKKTPGVDSTYDKNDFWSSITKAGAKFWAELNWMSDGQQLWDYIKQYNPTLLTAPSREQSSEIGKQEWINNNLPGTPVIFKQAKDKKDLAEPNAILIDDRKDNIQQWIDAGGIGIRHTSTESTIKQLQKLGL
jgi:predicted kinase